MFLSAQSADEFYKSGLRNVAEKQFRAAIKDFSKAIQLDSMYIEAWTARGDAWEELKSKRKANADWQQAYYLMGNERFKAGAREDACIYWNYASVMGHFKAYELFEKHCKRKEP